MKSSGSDQESQHLTQQAIPALPWRKPIIPQQRMITNSGGRKAQCRVGIIRVRRAIAIYLAIYLRHPVSSNTRQHLTGNELLRPSLQQCAPTIYWGRVWVSPYPHLSCAYSGVIHYLYTIGVCARIMAPHSHHRRKKKSLLGCFYS